MLANYWRAISKMLVESDDETSVIFKTNGLQMFHSASPAIFLHLANLKDFKTETVRDIDETSFRKPARGIHWRLDTGILETWKYGIWSKSGGDSQVRDGPFDRDAQSARQ